MLQVLKRILDHQRKRVGIPERVPYDVEPVGVPELLGVIPLIDGEANRLTAFSALHLDAPDVAIQVTVARLRVCWAEAADVEPDLLMADARTFPAARFLVRDDDVLGGEFDPAFHLGIKFFNCTGDHCIASLGGRNDDRRRDVSNRAMASDGQTVEPGEAFPMTAFEVGEVVLGTLPGESDLGRAVLPRA